MIEVLLYVIGFVLGDNALYRFGKKSGLVTKLSFRNFFLGSAIAIIFFGVLILLAS